MNNIFDDVKTDTIKVVKAKELFNQFMTEGIMKQKKRSLTVSDVHMIIARKIGAGSASYGVRIALDNYDMSKNKNKRT